MKNQKKNIFVFAGTSEGRAVAEYLSGLDVNTYISVATEYGMECVEYIPNVSVMAGRMDQMEMEQSIRDRNIDLVIDATHPYAQVVTANIKSACAACNAPYIRCLREISSERLEEETGCILVDTVADAVAYLKACEGNILIATGSKELKLYTAIPDYQERCYARVLSTLEAVEESVALGFRGTHLIAMQGPFSESLNMAMLIHTKAAYFVTKESGKAGGFKEKLDAAKATGVTLVVVGRPCEKGYTMEALKGKIQNILTNDLKRDSPFCKGDSPL